MPTTIAMLLDHLADRIVYAPGTLIRRFSWVALIVPEQENDPIEEDTLYCGTEFDAIAFLDHHDDAVALGIRGEPGPIDLPGTCSSRLILVYDIRSFVAVYEDIRRFFLRYERWTERMRTVLFKGGDYQALLDCSQGIFEDFVSITDSSFRLLAWTKDTAIDDPVALHLIERGYHSKETVDSFKRHGAIRRWRTQTGIVRVETARIAADPTLSYVFRMHGNYFVHVVLQCTKNPISDALVDTFQLLLDYLELYVRHDWTVQHRFNQDYSALLRDLVMRRPQNRDMLRKRLSQLDVPYEADYRLCVMELDGEEDGIQRTLGYFAWRLLELIPLGKVSIFQERLLLLVSMGEWESERTGMRELYRRLTSFQRSFGGTVGVSNGFSCIEDVSYAYRQARLAIGYGQRNDRTLAMRYEAVSSDCPVYSFESFFSAYIYDQGSRDVPLTRYCVDKSLVADIADYDREHGTDDLHLLYCYLTNERRANEAAAELHMHRNTLVYRIERLQERFSVDLSSRSTRERIMLIYHLMSEKHVETG